MEALPGGGDCDALACAEGRLIYVETKSAPPRHIDQKHVEAFYDRLEALRPDMAILLDDAKLRMHDKLAKMFELEIARHLSPDPPVLERVEGEIFTIRKRVFLANSQPDLVRAIGICLEKFFASLLYCMSVGFCERACLEPLADGVLNRLGRPRQAQTCSGGPSITSSRAAKNLQTANLRVD